MVSPRGFGCCWGKPGSVRLLIKERTRSQKPDGFEESEVQRKTVGCCIWAYMMDAESWDGGEAQVGRGGGDRNLLSVAGVGMV